MAYARETTVDTGPGGDTAKQGFIDLDTDLTNIFTNLNAHEALTVTHGATGAVVGTTNTQTLTNKTISGATLTGTITATGATISSPTLTGTVTASGATITGGTTVNQTIQAPTLTGTITATGATINSPVITGGSTTNQTITTPAITGGTNINQTITTPTLTGDVTASGATINSPTLTGTVTASGATITGGSLVNQTITNPTITTGSITAVRINPRVGSIASSATPSIDTDSYDCYSITALAADITSMTSGLSGTPVNFQKLIIRIKDDGTARAITWGASFEAKGTALPTTTVLGKVLTVGFIYDTVTSKWGCVASAQEA